MPEHCYRSSVKIGSLISLWEQISSLFHRNTESEMCILMLYKLYYFIDSTLPVHCKVQRGLWKR